MASSSSSSSAWSIMLAAAPGISLEVIVTIKCDALCDSRLYSPILSICTAHHWEVRAAQPATHLSSTPPNSNVLLPAFVYRTAHSSADTAAAASTARIATNRPAPGMGRARPGPHVHGAHPRKNFSTDKGMVANLCLEALGNFSSDLRTQTYWHLRLILAAV
jgi:hypothetical protein